MGTHTRFSILFQQLQVLFLFVPPILYLDIVIIHIGAVTAQVFADCASIYWA